MPVACVTGATGMIGRRIVDQLIAIGYTVRVLTRRRFESMRVHVFRGSLSDLSVMEQFICGADAVFHCAAELVDDSRMQSTNVDGTRLLAALVDNHRVKYLCYLSSAGVVGETSLCIVYEDCPCRPQNLYEKTKLEAERIVEQPIVGCRTVILRPTNVIDANHLGELGLAVSGTFLSWLKAVFKGAECAHIVHADDVANAALFFLTRTGFPSPQKYFVSIDEDPENTVANLWMAYRDIRSGKIHGKASWPFPHVPSSIPYHLRLMSGRPSNHGETKYSSRKLLAEGFVYSKGVRESIKAVLLERERNSVKF